MKTSIEKYQAIASIASSIAIPVVIAIIGYLAQSKLTDEGLKKDYVSIATGILKDSSAGQEPDLRKWAVAVLDKNSPVPFSSKAKESLVSGTPIILPGPAIPPPPEKCMTPPLQRNVYKAHTQLSKQKFGNQGEAIEKLLTFSELVMKEEYNAGVTSASLACLQNWARIVVEGDNEYRKSIGAPDSKSVFEKIASAQAALASSASSPK